MEGGVDATICSAACRTPRPEAAAIASPIPTDALGLSANALSKALGVPVNRVTMILNGQRGVSADTALRLARYFGTTPQLWLNLQKTWELRQADIESGREIVERVTPRPSAA